MTRIAGWEMAAAGELSGDAVAEGRAQEAARWRDVVAAHHAGEVSLRVRTTDAVRQVQDAVGRLVAELARGR